MRPSQSAGLCLEPGQGHARRTRGARAVVAVIETIVERPIDAIVADWNLLDDSIVAKFTMFRTMGQNIFGVRRHAITRTQIVDVTKHMTTALLELGPGG